MYYDDIWNPLKKATTNTSTQYNNIHFLAIIHINLQAKFLPK